MACCQECASTCVAHSKCDVYALHALFEQCKAIFLRADKFTAHFASSHKRTKMLMMTEEVHERANLLKPQRDCITRARSVSLLPFANSGARADPYANKVCRSWTPCEGAVTVPGTESDRDALIRQMDTVAEVYALSNDTSAECNGAASTLHLLSCT